LEHNNYKPQRTTRCAIEMVLEEEVLWRVKEYIIGTRI
jgi:hypothetical protein